MPRPRKKPDRVTTVQFPATHVDMIDRRVWEIIRKCCHDPNIVESISRSCYLQGLIDGAVVAAGDPALVDALKEIA